MQKFTFQYVSIKTRKAMRKLSRLSLFTFQYVSIKTTFNIFDKFL